MELLLIGDPITAERALELNLINSVVPQEELRKTAQQTAERLCENGPLAVQAIKELAIRSQYMNLDDGIRMEGAYARILMATEDAKEGPKAFLEKRKANFKGV